MNNFITLLWEVFLNLKIRQQESPELYHWLDIIDADFWMTLLKVLVWLEKLNKLDDKPK